MQYHIYEAKDYLKMPWKNGQGFTREIRREPAEGDFHWRLSIAQIKENGPFSSFPHYTRIISTLTGAGMVLTVDGTKSRPLRQYDPFIFSGASSVESELIDGPIEDFNLIFNPDFYQANLKWLNMDQSVEITGGTVLIYSVGGHTIKCAGQAAKVSSGSTLEIINNEDKRISLLIEASPGSKDRHFGLMEIRPA